MTIINNINEGLKERVLEFFKEDRRPNGYFEGDVFENITLSQYSETPKYINIEIVFTVKFYIYVTVNTDNNLVFTAYSPYYVAETSTEDMLLNWKNIFPLF